MVIEMLLNSDIKKKLCSSEFTFLEKKEIFDK
jgi:hypothetical protein